ncbi:MAG: zinc-binding dehydrogenase [Rhodobacteraceae bacterium]|nr:zinc-binding dehydrogenase [Paracoccaceae bacterium]
MKAITYRSFGPARDVLQVEEIACPAPAPGEVTVDIVCSAVNPSDVKARAGARVGVTELPWPFIIPHSDGAGVISAVGDGVDPGRIGQRVWLWNGQWHRPMGTAAEQITLPHDQAVALPEGVGFDSGAVLGIPGLTACHAVFSGGDVRGKTVLVQGGAGTVGLLAVQLAKWGGATVIATAGAGNKDRVLAAGADAVADYKAPDLADRILAETNGVPVDHIVEVEFGTNAQVDTDVIAENGRITAFGSAREMTPVLPFYPLMFKSVTLEMMLVYLLNAEKRQAAIARLDDALADGALTIAVQERFDLLQGAAAHEAVEAGNRSGAVLIETGFSG